MSEKSDSTQSSKDSEYDVSEWLIPTLSLVNEGTDQITCTDKKDLIPKFKLYEPTSRTSLENDASEKSFIVLGKSSLEPMSQDLMANCAQKSVLDVSLYKISFN